MKRALIFFLTLTYCSTLYGQPEAPERQHYTSPAPDLIQLFPLYGDVETLIIRQYSSVYNRATETTTNTALRTLSFRFNEQGDVITSEWWLDEHRFENMSSSFDEGSYRTTYIYNTDNLVISETRTTLDSLKPTLLSAHSFTYDKHNRLTTKTLYNARGILSRKQTYSYDEQGRLLEYRFYNNKGQEAKGETHIFNDKGQHVQTTSSREGTVVEIEQYTYDEKGRKIEHKYLTTDSTPFRVHRMEYDRKGRITDSITRYLRSKHSAFDRTTYTYDRKGRIKTKISTSTDLYNTTRTTTYTYKKNYYTLKSIFTHDEEISYTGSQIRNYKQIYDNDGQIIRSESYYPNGDVGYCYTYEYNTENQLIHSTILNNDWHELFTPGYEERSYTYDRYGNCTHILIKESRSPDADTFSTQHVDYIITYRK